MSSVQFNPSWPIYVESHATCPGGLGVAHLFINTTEDTSLLWVIFLNDSGECWMIPNHEIREIKNITYGRDDKLSKTKA